MGKGLCYGKRKGGGPELLDRGFFPLPKVPSWVIATLSASVFHCGVESKAPTLPGGQEVRGGVTPGLWQMLG